MAQHKQGIPGFENSSEEDQKIMMHRIFNRVFNTPDGRIVFNWILNDLHYFTPAENEYEKALVNYGKILVLDRMGITDSIAVTDAMLTSYEEEFTGKEIKEDGRDSNDN